MSTVGRLFWWLFWYALAVLNVYNTITAIREGRDVWAAFYAVAALLALGLTRRDE